MANPLKKITTRAKQLKKTHPGAAWKNLVKQAGREYRAGKLGSAAVSATKKKKVWQTGSSLKKNDSQRKAKPPGRRRSASGQTYIERRKNRSDKPGMLTGITTATLTSALRSRLKDQLGRNLVARETATSRGAFVRANKAVKDTRAKLRRLD